MQGSRSLFSRRPEIPGCQPTLLDEELKRKATLTRRGAFLAKLEASAP